MGLKKWDVDQLRAVILDLQRRTLAAGRYPPEAFLGAYRDRRRHHVEGVVPFRCVAYNQGALRLVALDRLLALVERTP